MDTQQKPIMGVDLNIKHYSIVAAIPATNKIYQLGRYGAKMRQIFLESHMTESDLRIYNLYVDELARSFIEIAAAEGVIVVMESLPEDIQGGFKSGDIRFLWNRKELVDAIYRHADEQNVTIKTINAKYTSQQCPLCGNIGKRSDGLFTCVDCDYEEDADVNAAIVIAKRYTGELEEPKKGRK